MPAHASSDSFFSPDRVLPQHQAALTCIKDRVDCPTVSSQRWLDLGSGKGQMVSSAERVFGASSKKIDFTSVEIDQDSARNTERQAESAFGKVRVRVAELPRFEAVLDRDEVFDFVSLINVVHEIPPQDLATLLIAGLCRTSENGEFYIYDMESLEPPELGAITWKGAEIQEVFRCALEVGGERRYTPQSATWPHKSCRGWSLHINRRYIDLPSGALNGARHAMAAAAERTLFTVLQSKLVAINSALLALCKYGPSTPDEEKEITKLTYEFWAISRTLGCVASLGSKS